MTARRAKAPQVAAVMVLTMLAWFAAQWLGGRLGWDARLALLFDFAALGAFVWALAATWRMWRARRADLGE